MKKNIMILLLIVLMLLLCGCAEQTASGGAETTTDTVPEILSQTEYLLYQNVFYNQYGPQLEEKETEKRGVFGRIYDAFSGRDRYYVWGYLDNTRCCDWQWEIVPKDPGTLPPSGSLVSVRGIFRASESALDGYWIEDAAFTTEARYTPAQTEINMLTLSGTLERVQIQNILYRQQVFEGKRFAAYGRIAGVGVLEDPYYNGSWQIPFSSSASSPSIGTMVVLRGTVKGGTFSDCTLEIAP